MKGYHILTAKNKQILELDQLCGWQPESYGWTFKSLYQARQFFAANFEKHSSDIWIEGPNGGKWPTNIKKRGVL